MDTGTAPKWLAWIKPLVVVLAIALAFVAALMVTIVVMLPMLR